jgi:hypothetical protein
MGWGGPSRGALTALALFVLLGVGTEPMADAEFTKIGNDGRELPLDASLGADRADWACLRDNGTDLVWEVKTADKALRDRHWTYTPYDSNPATNGGYPGYKDTTSGDCIRGLMAGGSCNTEAYINAVAKSRLCGFDDWRLPTVRELVAVSGETTESDPAATAHVLPNTESGWYWTGAEKVGITNFSRVILLPPAGRPTFYDGSYLVIAVRGKKSRWKSSRRFLDSFLQIGIQESTRPDRYRMSPAKEYRAFDTSSRRGLAREQSGQLIRGQARSYRRSSQSLPTLTFAAWQRYITVLSWRRRF